MMNLLKNIFHQTKVVNSSNYNDYVNYYLWCKKNTIKEYEKLVEYEKRGNIKSSEKIIQVNALGDMIDDIIWKFGYNLNLWNL